jgi:hypothetical protein
MNQSVCDDCTTVLDILNTFNGVFIFNYQHIHSCVMYLTKSLFDRGISLDHVVCMTFQGII